MTTLKARSFFRGRPVGPLVARTFTRVHPRPASAPPRGEEGFAGWRFTGSLEIPADDVYLFALTAGGEWKEVPARAP